MNQLIEFLITSSVLILVVIIIRACFMGKVKNSIIYALWLVVLVRLICPVNFFESSFSVMNGVEVIQSSVAEPNNVSDQSVNDVSKSNNSEISNTGNISQNINLQDISRNDEEKLKNNVSYPISDMNAEQTINIAKTENVNISLIKFIEILWLIGVLLCLLVFILSNIRFRRLLQRDRKLLVEYSEGKCKVYKTSKVTTPCLYGVFAPAIYIPEIVLYKLSEADIEQILEHENRHYIHKDHLWSFVRCLLVSIYWFHPLVWVAAKLSKKDAELFCDESILACKNSQERVKYGEMLLNVARVCNKTSMLYPITAVHSGKKEMKKRIVFIGKSKKYYKIIALLLFILLLAGSLITFTARKEEEEKKSKDYTITDVVRNINGYEITMPQVEGLDAETEEYINETIRIRISNIVKQFKKEGTINFFEYSIENKSEGILSILIQYDYMAKNGNHPFVKAFAINIDIDNKKIINKEEIINRNQAQYAYEKGYLKKVIKNSHGLEGDSVLKNEEAIESFNDIENNQFYISGNKVGLIYELIYARGSYEILETVDMRNDDYGIIQYTDAWSNMEYSYKGTIMCQDDKYIEKGNMDLTCYEYPEDIKASGTIFELEYCAGDYFTLGYLYVTEDKIYKFSNIDEGIERLENNQIPKDAYVVCQREEMEDALGENEKGWHRYIEVKGDTIEYHSYNNQTETGFYETIIWKKNVGITFYQNGYGAGRDGVKFEIDESNSLINKYNKIMESYVDENVYEVIEEDLNGDGDEEAFVVINFEIEDDSETYPTGEGCELWLVDNNDIKQVTKETDCFGGNIQMISMGKQKHILFNVENVKYGGSKTIIYRINNENIEIVFEQKHTNMYARQYGLVAYGEEYFHYDRMTKLWMGYCTIPYSFYWNEDEGTYKEYEAEEITEEEFLTYSGAGAFLDRVLEACDNRHTGELEVIKVEREYLKREDETIDVNLIIFQKNGDRIKKYTVCNIDGNKVEYDEEIVLVEGNKRVSLIKKLKEFEESIK